MHTHSKIQEEFETDGADDEKTTAGSFRFQLDPYCLARTIFISPCGKYYLTLCNFRSTDARVHKKLMRAMKYKCLREERKKDRRKTWAPYVRAEIDAVKNIAWALQIFMLQMGTLHDHITLTQLKRMPILQRTLEAHAADIYNVMFRDDATSKFIVSDTQNKHLDGRIGRILSFDPIACGFRVELLPKRKDSGKKCHKTMLKPENMDMLHKVPAERYNSIPKTETVSISIPHHFVALGSPKEVSVDFVANIFLTLRQEYAYFEQSEDIAFETLIRLIDEHNASKQEQQHRLEMETIEFQQACEHLQSSRLNRTQQPNKRRRANRAMPTATRVDQIVSVWNGKFDHVREQVQSRADTNATEDDYLFTLPFRTTDRTLMQASEGLSNFSCISARATEETLEQEMNGQHIIMTKASVETTAPGCDVDDDVFNLVHKWYVIAPDIFVVIQEKISQQLIRPDRRMTCGQEQFLSFPTSFLHKVFASTADEWPHVTNIDPQHIFSCEGLFVPFSTEARTTLFVVIGAGNIHEYQRKGFSGNRPCILEFNPYVDQISRVHVPSVVSKIYAWLNKMWRVQTGGDYLTNPFHKRSMPLCSTIGKSFRNATSRRPPKRPPNL